MFLVVGKTHSILSGVPVSTQGRSAIPPLSMKTRGGGRRDKKAAAVSYHLALETVLIKKDLQHSAYMHVR